jgi:phosphatidylserine decarboxylase
MSQLDKDEIKRAFSSLWASMKKAVPPIHSEGHVFIGVFAAVTLFLAWMHFSFLFALGLVLTIWCVAFFRDPPRITPVDANLIVSPADGTVCAIGQVLPPVEINLSDAPLTRISIFMSVFDGHINRAPIDGQVTTISYSPGLFLNADLDKASEDNERNALIIEAAEHKIGVVQIAGLIARRIVCFAKEGDQLHAGERFGLIRFGSRVDVYAPSDVELLVAVGQKTIAGETVLAAFKPTGAAKQFEVN